MRVKLAALLTLEVVVLGIWQLMAMADRTSEIAPLKQNWWHLLVTLVVMLSFWWLIKLASQAHTKLEPSELGWRRWLLASLPAALLSFAVIYLWEIVVTGLRVPTVLLPAPSVIGEVFAGNLGTLWSDFVQTVVKSVIPGYLIGCGLGMSVAGLAWRFPAVGRGLLPLGNFMSVMPIVGVAPIMVMWFGFDWQSKAAVAVLMTFFPMLVNSLAGLGSAGVQEMDLMRTYAAPRSAVFTKLVVPAAMPFVFNGLKICSTLALIGAIVAEFFGTPIVGMGFRISSEVGRMGLDMVWATIIVSALVGTSAYGLLVLLEKRVTFWEPSWRAS